MGRMGEGETYSTARGVITLAVAGQIAAVIQGQIYEVIDPNLLTPTQGRAVLLDYIPASGQWMLVCILP